MQNYIFWNNHQNISSPPPLSQNVQQHPLPRTSGSTFLAWQSHPLGLSLRRLLFSACTERLCHLIERDKALLKANHVGSNLPSYTEQTCDAWCWYEPHTHIHFQIDVTVLARGMHKDPYVFASIGMHIEGVCDSHPCDKKLQFIRSCLYHRFFGYHVLGSTSEKTCGLCPLCFSLGWSPTFGWKNSIANCYNSLLRSIGMRPH